MLKPFFSKVTLSCLMLSFLMIGQLTAQNLSDPLPTDPQVTKGKLENGLTYYIRPNAKPANKVELRLMIQAGSILEDEKQLGLAHFMEHMNFNGSKNFEENELVDYLQSLGVDFGADLNAYTGFDQTVYILPIPTDKPGNLETGFQILEDWAHNALITDKAIDDERGVVLEESRMGKGANDRMMKKFLPKVLAGSLYAERLPIGKDEVLKNFEYDEVRRYYRDWYRPNLMAVAVVGDITKEKAEALIKKHFAGIKNPANAPERRYAEVKPFTTASAMVLTDREAMNYDFSLIFSAKKQAPTKTLGDYRQGIVRALFTQILNKRFRDIAQGAQPPFVYAYASIGNFMGFTLNHEGLMLGAAPSGTIEEAVNAVVAELLKAQQYGFNTSEMELAKKSMMSRVEKVYNERNTTESGTIIAEYVRNFTEDEPIPGIENEYQYYKTFLPSITMEELNQVAREWLAPEYLANYFAMVTGPENGDKEMPSDSELLNAVRAAFEQTVTANEEKVVAENLLAEEPTPGSIVKEEKNSKLGTVTYTLSNGIKVTTKKTDFKSDEILFQGVKKGGKNNYGVADKSNVTFLSEVIESMGYGDFTPTELTDALSGKTLRLTNSLGDISNNVNGSSSVEHFDALLELNYLQLTSPRFDEALYKSFADKMKTQFMFMKGNPQVAFLDTMIKVMFDNNPLHPIAIPSAEDFDKIDPKRVIEIFKKEFSNAGGFHFFIVGNIDESTLKPLLEKYVASLPTEEGTYTFKDNGLRMNKGNVVFEFKKGSDPKSLIIASYHGEHAYSEDLALHMSMLGDIMTIKVIEEMREKMGAIYGGGISGSMSRDPFSNYSISMQLPCGPENVQPLLDEAKLQITAIKQQGPSQKDLDKVKASLLEKHKENLKKNNYWVKKLENLIFWDYSQARFLDLENRIKNVSTADIKKAANIAFNGENSFIGILNPETAPATEKAEAGQEEGVLAE